MRRLIILGVSLILLAGCGGEMDTDSMIGMSISMLEQKHQLQGALVWETPSLPQSAEGEKTFYEHEIELQKHD